MQHQIKDFSRLIIQDLEPFIIVILLCAYIHAAADYSLPHNETTRCHQEEHALVIGLIIASLSIFVHVTLIILVVSIALIVKSQYRR